MNETAQYWYNLWVKYSNDLSTNQQERTKLANFKNEISDLEISDQLVNNIKDAILYYENGGCILAEGEIVGGEALPEALKLFEEASKLYKTLIEKLDLELSSLKTEAERLYRKKDEAYYNYRKYYNSSDSSSVPAPPVEEVKIGAQLADVDWNYYVPEDGY